MSRGNGNLVPMIVIGIIVFISYQSNPEYWKQGKLFNDMKTTSSSTIVDTKDVANIPAQTPPPAAKPYNGNQSQESEGVAKSGIRGARVIPPDVFASVGYNDPAYGIIRSSYKVIYFNYPNAERGERIYSDIKSGLSRAGLSSDVLLVKNIYKPIGSNNAIEKSTFVGQDYLNKNCTKYICMLNPNKREIIFVNQSAGSVISKLKELRNW